MKNIDLKAIVRSKVTRNVSIAIVTGCIMAGFYITGFEAGRNTPETYKYYPAYQTLATVGDETIKVSVLKRQMNMLFASEPTKKYTEEEIAESEQMYIDYIITREALKQRAEKEGLTVTSESVDSQYNDLVASLESAYSLTKDEIFKKFKITEEYLRESVRAELLGNAYLDKISEVTDEEATEYFYANEADYNQCKASHILIMTVDENFEELSEEEIEEKRELAQSILDRILAGEDFATLAKEYSEDASAEDGGDLGFFGKDEMIEAFETAAFALEVGEVTPELVKTDYGFHIIKKTGEQNANLEDSLQTIKDELEYQKKYDMMKEVLGAEDVIIKYQI